MSSSKRLIVGLFVEGSRPTDPLRDDFASMWKLLGSHCGHQTELRVFGISKGHVIRLESVPVQPRATQLIKGQRQLVGSGEPLDIAIQRAHEKEKLDRVIIAFDRWRANQLLTLEEQKLACPMRPEVAFVLGRLATSNHLDGIFRDAARTLLARYESRETLVPRAGNCGTLEVLFMDPMFEALFTSDQATVRRALGVEKKKPKDWPKFKTHEPELDKAVLDVAVWAATGKRVGYTSAKARWGHVFVKAATADAAIWRHPIAVRLCRAMAA